MYIYIYTHIYGYKKHAEFFWKLGMPCSGLPIKDDKDDIIVGSNWGFGWVIPPDSNLPSKWV